MKKVFLSMLMISAMFMIASCGGNSNSNETSSEEKTEEESVEEVEFSDPAIVFGTGVDLTSYFSPVKVGQPTIYYDKSKDYRLSINVKLKVTKKPNLKSTFKMPAGYEEHEEMLKSAGFKEPTIHFVAKFCDKGGSSIDESNYYDYTYKPEDLSEGSTISLDFLGHKEGWESDANDKLSKVKYIEISVSTEDAEIVNE
jgi:hypothetical protein